MTLSAAELTHIRTAINNLLPDTCNILSPTNTVDGQGGQTTAWGTVAGGTAVKCRLDTITGSEQGKAEQWQTFTRYIMTLPYDSTVLSTYRIEHSSVTYNVVSVDNNKSWNGSTRVEVYPI